MYIVMFLVEAEMPIDQLCTLMLSPQNCPKATAGLFSAHHDPF